MSEFPSSLLTEEQIVLEAPYDYIDKSKIKLQKIEARKQQTISKIYELDTLRKNASRAKRKDLTSKIQKLNAYGRFLDIERDAILKFDYCWKSAYENLNFPQLLLELVDEFQIGRTKRLKAFGADPDTVRDCVGFLKWAHELHERAGLRGSREMAEGEDG